ncbi:hypothetical protein KCU87_g252, partial [Aureobasidium melanogenum]
MDEFDESQTTSKPTNRDNFQVAAESLETLACELHLNNPLTCHEHVEGSTDLSPGFSLQFAALDIPKVKLRPVAGDHSRGFLFKSFIAGLPTVFSSLMRRRTTDLIVW